MKQLAILSLFLGTVCVAAASFAASSTNILVKADGEAVYYLGTDNKRYVFPNERVFKSWYPDFSGVVTVSDTQLATYPIGGNIRYRPGTRLVKITTDPKVYAVGPGGSFSPIASEQAAMDLYGPDWAKRVDDLPDVYFTDYHEAEALDGSTHPAGTLLHYTDNSTAYYLLESLDGSLSGRSVNLTQLPALGLDASFALSIDKNRFSYPTAAPLTGSDTSLLYPNQPSANVPQSPEEPEEPAPTPATLTLTNYAALGTSLTMVKGDNTARLYAFTLTGDKTHGINVSRLRLQTFIDAGGLDADFVQGSDTDAFTTWTANQLISDLTLRDLATGQTLGSLAFLPGDGLAEFPLNLTIAAGKQIDVEVVARVNTSSQTVRLAAGLTPGKDVTATASSASALTITPSTPTNGSTTPGIIAKVLDHGSMKITTTTSGGDTMRPLGVDFTPFSLVFTTTGEPFTVQALTLETTLEGPAIWAVNEVLLAYKTVNGTSKTDRHSSMEGDQIRFINMELSVPKNSTVTVPVLVSPTAFADAFSNSRLQLKFITDAFDSQSNYSLMPHTGDHFTNAGRLTNATSASPLTLFRQATLQFTNNTSSPSGVISRYNKKPVLIFNVTAKDGPVKIHQLTFRIETSDVNVEGDDNDFLERFADVFANERSGLYGHSDDLEERGRFGAQTVMFKIFDASAILFDDTPAGLQTGSGDYGLLVYNFGGNPITLDENQSLTLDFDLDTTLISADTSTSLKIRLLGDSKGSGTSEANFLYDDGTGIKASGYLIGGLELSSATMAVDK